MAIKVILALGRDQGRPEVRELILGQPDMKVVAEVSDGRAAVWIARKEAGNVIVLGLPLTSAAVIRAVEAALAEPPGVKMVLVSPARGDRDVPGLLKAGASAWVGAKHVGQELVAAIRAVADGGTYLDSSGAVRSPQRKAALTGE